MSPSRWRELREIAAQALNLPTEQRLAYIDRSCAGNPRLKEQLERLMADGSTAITQLLDHSSRAGQEASSLPEGMLLGGRFRILGFLARGGMGEVYRARDEELQEDIALKVISKEIADRPAIVERFRKEVQRARHITHPNVCRIHDLESHLLPDDTILRFLTMQLIEGPTLAGLMAVGPVPQTEALPLLEDVLAGLDAAHYAKIAHCDLKPNNVLLDRRPGQRERAVITDFGLARALRPETDTESTRTGVEGGSPSYMAPELRFGASSSVSGDIFAFGVLAYELLTGRHPFNSRPPWEMGEKFRVEPPRSLSPDIPREWDSAIVRSLDFNVAARFATVEELRSAVGATVPGTKWSGTAISRRGLGYAAGGVIVAGAAVAGYLRWFAKPESIAVLPFENASKDESLDYLSMGITDSLINSLAQLPRLRVPAAGLVRRFKGDPNPTKAGAELNTSAVLSGVLRRREGLLSVDVELIDVSSGKQIWGKQYTLTWTNTLDVQESICADILAGLQIRMGNEETRSMRRGLTADEEAFQLYLRGQYLLGLRRVDTLLKSRELFQQALNRDPDFALAWSGLASSEMLLGYFGVESPRTSMTAARTSAQKAVSLEPTVAEAHTVIGAVKVMFDWDWKGAEASFRQAIALKGDLAEAHHWYARFVLSSLGRHGEAVAEMKRAIKWDPYGPILHTNLGVILYYARHFDEAIAQLQRVVEMDPRFDIAYWTLAQAWAAKGNLNKAAEAIHTAQGLQPGPKPDLILAYCYAACGQPAEGRRLRNSVVAKYRPPSYSECEIAYVSAVLDEPEEAVRSLEVSCENREPLLIHTGADPKFDRIRNTAGYRDVLRRIGLTSGI